jgi:phenylacetyl-CoA:acceptor oxidoreductase
MGNETRSSGLKTIRNEVKEQRKPQEDIWIPAVCGWQCVEGPCLLRVRRINGVAVSIEPNREIQGFEQLTKNQGRLCPKAYGLLQKLYNPHRITGPLKRTNPQKGPGVDPKWVSITWDEALDIIAERLKKIRAEDSSRLAQGGPGLGAYDIQTWYPFFSAFGYTQRLRGGRSTRCDEAEHAFGSRIHGAYQCEPDLDFCNYLILFGSNPSASGGTPENVLFANARERGIKTVLIDPVLTVTGATVDEWLPIRPGTDTALMLAMINVIICELGIYDKVFLKEMTNSPYLVKADGYFLRDRKTGKVLVWDPIDQKGKTYDDPTIKDFALEGTYIIEGIKCRPAFQVLMDEVKPYTPEWASFITEIDSDVIRRIAREFVDKAKIGSTINIGGLTLPYRPVATKLGRGITGVMHGYQAVLANHILAALVGSIEVPGGHMGGHIFQEGVREDDILFHLFWLDPGITAVDNGMLEVYHYPFIWPPKTYGAVEILCPFTSHHSHAQPPNMDPLGPHFQLEHLNWRNLVDPPKNLPIPPSPEAWIVYRSNPLLAIGESGIISSAMKKIPFIVSIAYSIDEVTEFADIVLPEQVELERYTLHYSIRSACHRKYFIIAIDQPVVQLPNTMNANDIFTELADRIGILDDYNMNINQRLGLIDPYKLEPGKKYKIEEIVDRQIKSYTNGAYDLEWFKKNGALVRQVPPEVQYGIHLKMKNQKLRYPIPYMERVKKVGEELARNLATKGIDWWPTDGYTPLPKYFPSKLEEVAPEYEFYVTPARGIMLSWGNNVYNPWINELAEHVRGIGYILMNIDAAKAKGIKDGDEIWVESEAGRIKQKVQLCKGIRPDTLVISGQFGQWAMPIAKDTGRVTSNTITPIRIDWTDSVLGVQQGVIKAKVYKV